MRQRKLLNIFMILFAVACFPGNMVYGASVETEAISQEPGLIPIADGSGRYVKKSDGFYCVDEKENPEKKAAVHYFDHVDVNGTIFDGYYYHDESGKFVAGNPHMVYIKELKVECAGEDSEEVVFNGCYMVNNLGKLSGAPQVRYMDDLVMNGKTYNGFYYFNKYGRLTEDRMIRRVDMNACGQQFRGYYYFGGENGALLQEAGETPEGYTIDDTGRVKAGKLGIKKLEDQVQKQFRSYQGCWSIYVKDLGSDKEFAVNDRKLYSASLIKVFVMEASCANMEEVLKNQAAKLKLSEDDSKVRDKVDELLRNMITVSDNESFNELVRLQTASGVFADGAEKINAYLEKEGYTATTVQHVLSPSVSTDPGLGGRNMTSVGDCGKLLERIYRGTCVSKKDSEKMLDLLLSQEVTWKIPAGVPAEAKIANKTGETDDDQHDIAIIYGEKTTYILCVMSENGGETAGANIQALSGIVYNYLNME